MTTTVSAPGKVLAAGGYLVLDPAYFGVVFATDARFYTSVATRAAQPDGAPAIRVRSPQFDAAEWVYAVQLPADDDATRTEDVRLVQTYLAHSRSDANGANPFVAFALLYTLQLGIEKRGVSALRAALGGGVDVVIAGDNDYYSHRVEVRCPHSPRAKRRRLHSSTRSNRSPSSTARSATCTRRGSGRAPR